MINLEGEKIGSKGCLSLRSKTLSGGKGITFLP